MATDQTWLFAGRAEPLGLGATQTGWIMADEVRSERRGLSRRSALKGIGAGTAAIWAAPALVSLGRAHAQGSGIPSPCDNCNPADLCFGQQFDCAGNASCVC